MSSRSAIETFIANLKQSNLLGDATPPWLPPVDQLPADDDPRSAERFATRLVRDGQISGWQAKMLLSGKTAFYLGRYKLLEMLGQGGMGAVFRAEHVGLRRTVALKVMSDRLMRSPEMVARFRREIQAAAALDHRNIVLAYDADCVGNTHFLVMEYIEGDDLGAIVKRRGQLPVPEACRLIEQAARGLQHAHERDMVHRDVKPGNLLVQTSEISGRRSEAGRESAVRDPQSAIVKILDFGLARFTSEASTPGDLTTTGQVMGTPDYISPEQAQDAHAADIRSDIYSLGCTLFYAIAGRVPFEGNNAVERVTARVLKDAPRLASVCPDVPPGLDDVVARMLARNPDERFATPGEVADALLPFANAEDGQTVVTPTATGARAESRTAVIEKDDKFAHFLRDLSTRAEQSTEAFSTSPMLKKPRRSRMKSRRRDRKPGEAGESKLVAESRSRQTRSRKQMLWVLIGGAALTLLACVALTVWLIGGRSTLILNWPADERADATLEIDDRTLQPSGDLSFDLSPGRHRLRIARRGYESIDEVLELQRGETQTFAVVWKPTRKTAAIRAWIKLRDGTKRELSRIKRGTRFDDPRIRKLKSELIRFQQEYSDFPQAREAAAVARSLPAPIDLLQRRSIDPYELQLAGNGNAKRAPRELVAVLGSSRFAHSGSVTGVAYTLDEKTIISCGMGGSVRFWNAETGVEQTRSVFPRTVFVAMELSPDGQRLALLNGAGKVLLWDMNLRSEPLVLDASPNKVVDGRVAFTRDGKFVVSTGNDPFVRVWATATGKLVTKLEGHKNHPSRLAISRDGTFLATSASAKGTANTEVRLWTTADWKPFGPPRSYGKIHVNAIDFSPDGKTLATGMSNGRVWLRDVQTGKLIGGWANSVQTYSLIQLRYSPDGKMLVTGSAEGMIRFWKPDGKLWTTNPCGHAGWVRCLRFSRDGKTLLSAGRDGQISGVSDRLVRVWELKNFQERPDLKGRHGDITAMACSRDGRWLATAGANKQVRVWDLTTGRLAAESKTYDMLVRRLYNLEFTPKGGELAVGTIQYTTVFRWKSWESVAPVRRKATFTRFSPNGRFFVTGSHTKDNSGKQQHLHLWELVRNIATKRVTAERRRSLENSSKPVQALALDGKGEVAAAADKINALFFTWNVETGRRLRVFNANSRISSLAFADDDKALVTDETTGVFVYDVGTGQLRFPQAIGRLAPAVTPDGKRVVVANSPREGDSHAPIKIVNLTTGKVVRTIASAIPAKLFPIRRMLVTPDGRHLVIGNPNGTIHILRLSPAGPRQRSR